MDLSFILLLAAAPSASQANVSPAPVPVLIAPRPDYGSAMPIGNPGEWITVDDYPALALREGKEGVTWFKLIVSRLGRAIDCAITASSGSLELDEATCRLFKERGEFTPAKDAAGNAVYGDYYGRVRWVIPKEMDPPVAGSVVDQYFVEKDGSMTDCRILRSDEGMAEAPAVGPYPCSTLKIDPPFTNALGEPVRKRIIMTTSTAIEDVAK